MIDNIKLSDISTSPGVYIFLDAKSKPIYVGKAKNLRARLSSYFNASNKTIKTVRMLALAKDVKTIVTSNEVEAFLLEANLIKTEQPKYNILLKDSKTYPYVKLTGDEYPKLIYTRQIKEDDSDYYGPFISSTDIKLILEELQHVFPLRTCTDTKFKEHKFCLKYQIKRCLAPCVQYISKEDYGKLVSSVKSFFKGDTAGIKNSMVALMEGYSKSLQFEKSAILRDRINSLDKLFAKQSVIKINDERSIDLFYRHTIDGITGITQLFVRNGKLLGANTRFFVDEFEELLEQFVLQYYNNSRQFPDMVYLLGDDYSDELEEVLSIIAKRKVTVRKRGLAGLIDIAKENAEKETEDYKKKITTKLNVINRLKDILNIEHLSRIECVDISHLAGNHTVGVSILSVDGEFSRSGYKKYKIKEAKNDDFLSLYELFKRKFENVDEDSEQRADLYIIDGGVGQLQVVERLLKELNRDENIISISKSRGERKNKFDTDWNIEEVHIVGRKNPLKFKRNDSTLLFIQSQRDEAHRFAITYSRKLALRGLLESPLLKIDGMGKVRLRKLLESVPDIHNRKDLTAEKLAELSGLPIAVAQSVIKFINNR